MLALAGFFGDVLRMGRVWTGWKGWLIIIFLGKKSVKDEGRKLRLTTTLKFTFYRNLRKKNTPRNF